MDSIFSQPASGTGSQDKLTASEVKQTSNRRERKPKFRPPLKMRASEESQEEQRDEGTISGGVCHTVLSYCEEEEEMDTQPLSMFSGEGVKGDIVEDTGKMDDLFLQLDDPFSLSDSTQSSRWLKLDDTLIKPDNHFTNLNDSLNKMDDPLSKLDNPYSLSQDTNNTSPQCSDHIINLDNPLCESPATRELESGGEEQTVPSSPLLHSPGEKREKRQIERVIQEDEEEEKTEQAEVPRRRFKGRCGRQYNLELLPQQFRRAEVTGQRGRRERQRVNWASRVSVCGHGGREGSAGGGGGSKRRGEMGVFEVPLSVGEEREREVSCERSRENLSLSRLDMSHISRTKEQQLLLDSEVLAVIAKTRDEIRALRTKHAALMSSLDMSPPNENSSTYHHYSHKPQLHVQVVKGRKQ